MQIDTTLTEQKIQRVLGGFIASPKYSVDGLFVFGWESDKLIWTKAGYIYEFEIKISRSDYLNDFRHKVEKHLLLNSAMPDESTVTREADIKTWASIEPVIDWQSADMVIRKTLDCCDHYKIGLRSGVKKDYYDLMQSGQWLDDLTKKITAAGRTVYLKESARVLLRRCYKEDYYNKILSRTVDMDGNRMETTNFTN